MALRPRAAGASFGPTCRTIRRAVRYDRPGALPPTQLSRLRPSPGLDASETPFVNFLDVPYRYPARFAVVDGFRHAYVDVNEFAGEPVVFLHDVASDLDAFAAAYERIGATRRAIGFDFLGFGKSDRPPIDDAVVLYTNLLGGLLTTLDIDRASLVGHGLGAAVAVRFASEYPERVDRLVLSAIPAVDRLTEAEMATAMERWTSEVLVGLDRAGRRAWYQALAAGWNDLLEAELQLREELAHCVAYRAWARSVEDAMTSLLHHPVGHRLARITAPTLIIWGADDPVVSPLAATRAREELARARVEPLEPCGHLPTFEQPEAFVDAIDGFLSHSASGTLDGSIAMRIAADVEPWPGLSPGVGRLARRLFEQRDTLSDVTDGLTLDDVVWRPFDGAPAIGSLLLEAGAAVVRVHHEVLMGSAVPDEISTRFGFSTPDLAPRKSPNRLIAEIAWAHGQFESWLRERTDADLNRGFTREGSTETHTLRWLLWQLIEDTAAIRGKVELLRQMLAGRT